MIVDWLGGFVGVDAVLYHHWEASDSYHSTWGTDFRLVPCTSTCSCFWSLLSSCAARFIHLHLFQQIIIPIILVDVHLIGYFGFWFDFFVPHNIIQ